jgi:hypothetical protein
MTARKAVRQLRELRYEVGIDTYHFIQNSIPLLWLARIPVRIDTQAADLVRCLLMRILAGYR